MMALLVLILRRLLSKSQLRYLDRYVRQPRYADRPNSVSGYALVARLKRELDEWHHVRTRQGIRAAIALNG